MDKSYEVFWKSPASPRCDIVSTTITDGRVEILIDFHTEGVKRVIRFDDYLTVLSGDEGTILRMTLASDGAGTAGTIIRYLNSTFADWFKFASSEIHVVGKDDLNHWSVDTDNERVSIISYSKPSISDALT